MQAWFDSLKADFILNFVQANRWKYLWDGLGRTLLITLLAGVMGTIIGIIIAIPSDARSLALSTVSAACISPCCAEPPLSYS